MVGVDQRGPAERGRDRQVETLGKAGDAPGGFLGPARAAEDDERRLGAREHCAELVDIRGCRPAHGRLDAHGVGNGGGLGQHVLGKRDHDGTGAALHGDAEGARH